MERPGRRCETEEGAAQTFRNSTVRVRLVAGVAEAGVVSGTLKGRSISAGLRSLATASPLYLADEVNLQATRIYTVCMLGEASSPIGILHRDP